MWPIQKPLCHVRLLQLCQDESLVLNELIRVKLPSQKDTKADVSNESPSPSLSDYITKMPFRARALSRHFPIRLPR